MVAIETSEKLQAIQNEFITALLNGNRAACSSIAKSYMKSSKNFIHLYEEIIRHALYNVGKLWESNQISVATEHLATSIAESLLNELYETVISEQRLPLKVVVSSVANEFHQVGQHMVSHVFENHGWDTFILGANLPTNDLIRFIQQNKPDVLALSLTLYFNLPVLIDLLTVIENTFPDLKVVVGGQAFCHGGVKEIETFRNLSYIKDLNDLELFIQNFNQNG
ncbi:MAG: cobalamin-binding protein [Bacteroidetes bacterium HGW-Bacteroidetes-4]|jgi:methanogenic corrinoid protein MtbC1|nr:MAG: cobalamin-binding protein [Bacteroidetes bacterium HGW-Bacteroidetes-4]